MPRAVLGYQRKYKTYREVGEDYNAEFLIMLNTWEAPMDFSAAPRKNPQPVDILGFLGGQRLSAAAAIENMTPGNQPKHATLHVSRAEAAELFDVSERAVADAR